MTQVRALFPSLIVLTSLMLGFRGQAGNKTAFATQVGALLDSPWTEMHVTQALITDYGQIDGVTIELSREKPDGPVFYRSDSKAEKKKMPEEQEKKFREVLTAAAKEVESIETPPEVLSRVSIEEGARLIREGKLPTGWDVEVLVILGTKPATATPLTNGGGSQKLVDFLEHEFAIKRRELQREEVRQILGSDPYQGL